MQIPTTSGGYGYGSTRPGYGYGGGLGGGKPLFFIVHDGELGVTRSQVSGW